MNDFTLDNIDQLAFKRKVQKLNSLPTLPHLMIRFSQMADDPSTSMSTFGDELSKDQILTSRLLKLVNSAYYGFPGRIATVTQALVLLGVDAVKGLIITSSVFDNLNSEAYPLWRHSLLTSLTCRLICERLSIPDIEEISVAGLLHDIGKIIFFIEEPDIYRELIEKARIHEVPMHIAELKYLGFTHAQIGKWVGEQWTLPDKLIVPIGYHHTPLEAPEHKIRTYIVTVANHFVKALGAYGEKPAPFLDLPKQIFDELNLYPYHFDEFAPVIDSEREAIEHLGPTDIQ